MNAAQMSRIPPHVPPALTVDFNYYDQPGGRENPHDAWSRLHSGPDIFFTPQYGGHWVITRFKDLKAIFDDRDTRTCTHGLAHRALLEARSMRIRVRVFARHAHRHLHADRGIARGGSSAVVAMGRRQGAQSRRECPARGIERHDRLCAATGSRAPASSQ